VQSAGAAHKRSVNGILGLLCREHFPSLVEYGGVTELAYTFDHYAAAPDAEDRDGTVFNNKADVAPPPSLFASPRPPAEFSTPVSMDKF
jgi:hypothetical protein